MDPDLALTLGLVIVVFSIPSILSAFSDRRAPRASLVTVLIGGGLVVYAMQVQPGGYALTEIPDAFLRVVGQFIN